MEAKIQIHFAIQFLILLSHLPSPVEVEANRGLPGLRRGRPSPRRGPRRGERAAGFFLGGIGFLKLQKSGMVQRKNMRNVGLVKSFQTHTYLQNWQNMRLKALADIYTMHSFAPVSNLKIFVKNC